MAHAPLSAAFPTTTTATTATATTATATATRVQSPRRILTLGSKECLFFQKLKSQIPEPFSNLTLL